MSCLWWCRLPPLSSAIRAGERPLSDGSWCHVNLHFTALTTKGTHTQELSHLGPFGQRSLKLREIVLTTFFRTVGKVKSLKNEDVIEHGCPRRCFSIGFCKPHITLLELQAMYVPMSNNNENVYPKFSNIKVVFTLVNSKMCSFG